MPLDVRASGVDNITDIVDFTTPVFSSGDTFTYFNSYLSELGTGTSFKKKTITLNPQVDTSNIDIEPYKTYCVMLQTNGTGATATYHGSGTVNNVNIEGNTIEFFDVTGKTLSRLNGSSPYIYRGYALVQGIELLNGFTSSDNSTCNFSCIVGFVGTININGGGLNGAYITYKMPYNMTIYNLREGYQYINTTDMETKRQIQQSEQVINTTLEEANDIASDTNDTTHSIFDSITDFFGDFFSNLIGVFVPSDGFFTTWFNNLNTLLTNKLGILYYPFSVFIDLCTRLTSAFAETSQEHCYIYFPRVALPMNGQTLEIIPQTTVDLASFNIPIWNADTSNSSMFGLSSLIWVIRRLNNFALTLAIISLFRTKLNLILRGDNNDN